MWKCKTCDTEIIVEETKVKLYSLDKNKKYTEDTYLDTSSDYEIFLCSGCSSKFNKAELDKIAYWEEPKTEDFWYDNLFKKKFKFNLNDEMICINCGHVNKNGDKVTTCENCGTKYAVTFFESLFTQKPDKSKSRTVQVTLEVTPDDEYSDEASEGNCPICKKENIIK